MKMIVPLDGSKFSERALPVVTNADECFGDQFVRIESITEASDGRLRSLDLKEESVRDAVDEYAGAEVGALYESAASLPFT